MILIGAIPSIANGVIGGVDYVPELLVRAGRNIGAGGLSLYRLVVLPAALPSIVLASNRDGRSPGVHCSPARSWSPSPTGRVLASS